MTKARFGLWIAALTLALGACEADQPLEVGDGHGAVTLRGRAQKGPFLKGAAITVAGLDAQGRSLGTAYSTMTANDAGEFNLSLAGTLNYGEIVSEGYYFNEITGAPSQGPITLRALFLPVAGSQQRAHVNVITHMAQLRAKQLMLGGMDLGSAVNAAETSLRAALGVRHPTPGTVGLGTSMDILGGDTPDAQYLLALSCILGHAAAGSDANLQELLNAIAASLAPSGTLAPGLVAIVEKAERTVDPQVCMSNLHQWIARNALNLTVPDLTKVIDTDKDGIPNASDPDDDGDGDPDATDPAPLDPNAVSFAAAALFGGEGACAISGLDARGFRCEGPWAQLRPVGFTSTWTVVSAGLEDLCARSAANMLWCWRGGPAATPARIGGTDWQSIAVGLGGACAVKTDGSLGCWGRDAALRVRFDDAPVPVAPAGTWASVTAPEATAETLAFALKTGGTLWAVASPYAPPGAPLPASLTATQVGTDADWASVAAGGRGHRCALKTDHSLWCWGSNEDGQLGLGDTSERDAPAPVGSATDWAQVVVDNGASGARTTCARKLDGSLWCWGAVGPDTVLTPAKLPTTLLWKSIALGSKLCAIRDDDRLWCWPLGAAPQQVAVPNCGRAGACDDGNACTTDTCDPVAGCVHAPAAGPCDDGNPCTVDDQCAGGTCTGTPTAWCSDGGAIDAGPPDLSVPPADLAVPPPDLVSPPDLTMPDLTMPRDLSVPPDLSMPPDLSAPPCSLVINEVFPTSNLQFQFVEIYNPCNYVVDFSSWYLTARTADNIEYPLTIATPSSIPAHGVIAFGGTQYDFTGKIVALFLNGAFLSSSGGGVALRNGSNVVVDSVAYLSLITANGYTETAPAPNPGTGSLSRIPNGTDTNNNAADFQVTATPTLAAAN
ncbi:MAG TPA: hypothetical protein VGQ83_28865 [Polyangia bacterium]|jgi:hypothetical protein